MSTSSAKVLCNRHLYVIYLTSITEQREDLGSAFHWAGKWQMEFNPGKCKCVHFGHANPKHEYTMGAQKIAHSTEEKDLGVVINQSLSPSHHIATCVSRANRIVGLIKRTYENKSKRNIIALHKSLVRPHLEYCVQAWRPHNREDFFQLRTATGRRGHSLTILKQHRRLNVRKYFFTHRVVDTWNKPSEDTASKIRLTHGSNNTGGYT